MLGLGWFFNCFGGNDYLMFGNCDIDFVCVNISRLDIERVDDCGEKVVENWLMFWLDLYVYIGVMVMFRKWIFYRWVLIFSYVLIFSVFIFLNIVNYKL